MPDPTQILVANLLVDSLNPRLPLPNVGQHEALRTFANHQKTKLLRIAEDIIDNGLNPSELFIVTSLPENDERFIVLEGNRRLTAIRALENPEIVVDAVSKGVLNRLRNLSKRYQENPIDEAYCVVFRDREEAEHWIELKHTGQRGGAGTVPWEADEIGRWQSRRGIWEVEQQALNFLQAKNILSDEERRNVPVTTYRRLLNTAEIRDNVGIEVIEGKIKLLGNEDAVAKALKYIANDLAAGTIDSRSMGRVEARRNYAENLPDHIIVQSIHPSGEGIDPVTKLPDTKKRGPQARVAKPRDQLIPRDCILRIKNPRVRGIESELRKLSLDSYPNAVSVLLRVFIELSVDDYIDRMQVAIPNDNLSTKLQNAIKDLISRKQLTADQAKPVRQAAQRKSWLVPSVDMMHGYIHSQHIFPAPSDLRQHWNGLQSFIVALWAS